MTTLPGSCENFTTKLETKKTRHPKAKKRHHPSEEDSETFHKRSSRRRRKSLSVTDLARLNPSTETQKTLGCYSYYHNTSKNSGSNSSSIGASSAPGTRRSKAHGYLTPVSLGRSFGDHINSGEFQYSSSQWSLRSRSPISLSMVNQHRRSSSFGTFSTEEYFSSSNYTSTTGSGSDFPNDEEDLIRRSLEHCQMSAEGSSNNPRTHTRDQEAKNAEMFCNALRISLNKLCRSRGIESSFERRSTVTGIPEGSSITIHLGKEGQQRLTMKERAKVLSVILGTTHRFSESFTVRHYVTLKEQTFLVERKH